MLYLKEYCLIMVLHICHSIGCDLENKDLQPPCFNCRMFTVNRYPNMMEFICACDTILHVSQ